ncbi:glycosyltransferase family 4 protein [Methanobacterium paludis]|uniref:Phosphatidylinositol alpha-mannosyltransferase n=1 Tax=Methanobacterium paludis (strain DSM 25820 / JCM 18151 / SWAN1) TaxID=868131 RepID=F6D681_METPW|nr:glycosyltransferase family 4 protein [Methanobacterium paludis]AEG18294.1 Phosphatidylinositol alpha-mannosyltransferase [Methanobacterium paludis]
MNVGYFIGHFPYIDLLDDPDYVKKYAHGGTEMAAYNLAINMVNMGHEIDVFTTSIDSKDSLETYPHMKVHRYGTTMKIASANPSFKLIFKPLNHDVDIIHAHSPIPYSDIPALIYAKRKKVPFILTYQYDGQETGGSFIRNAGVFLYNKVFINKVLDYADVIIATTNSYANESKFLKGYKDKIVVIPNGINIEEVTTSYSKEECRNKLKLPDNENLILFLGSLVPYKGPDILLKALHRVKKEIPDVKLILAGRGPMLTELEELSKKLGLDENIEFLGFVDESLKPLYFKASNVFCLPSTTMAESFGIVNLEAMASGIPIVSSKLGGIPDIVKDGENGLLVKPGDVEGLADALIYLLKNEDVRGKMGDDGLKKVKRYSWEKIAEETEKIYKKLLEKY